MRAWEANKRHIRAISELHLLSNYGAQGEITLRLDAIVQMQDCGYFDPMYTRTLAALGGRFPWIKMAFATFPSGLLAPRI